MGSQRAQSTRLCYAENISHTFFPVGTNVFPRCFFKIASFSSVMKTTFFDVSNGRK